MYLSDPVKSFQAYLRQMGRDTKSEAKRLKRIDENCVRIRREEIRLVVNNDVHNNLIGR